jgi:hypothetical protein
MSLMSSLMNISELEESINKGSWVGVPKLLEENYSMWKVEFHNYMVKNGLEYHYSVEIPDYSIIKEQIDIEQNKSIGAGFSSYAASLKVRPLGQSSSSSNATTSVPSGTSASNGTMSTDKSVKENMIKVNRACSAIESAIPLKIKLLVKQFPVGYAYAIWKFLADKYENTDLINVGVLWALYFNVKMEELELYQFDQFRARYI